MKAMALLTDGAQNLGSYYCLIRRRFKRRRKKRSERKGKTSSQRWRAAWLGFMLFRNWNEAQTKILEYW